jgi:uncharacterized protein (TIGR00730 family)
MRSPKEYGPSPEKAYKNQAFLMGHHGRSIRIQCELTEPAVRFEEHQIKNTVCIFGSARILPEEEAMLRLEEAREIVVSQTTPTPEDIQRLRRAERLVASSHYYDKTVALAKALAEWSQSIANMDKRFYICSGGGPGIMEAANRGAAEAGAKSIALGISLPFEQHLNPYATDELCMEFHYFFVRKYWFMYMAKALIAMPGGFGTIDELFEMLTLVQTKKINKHIPIILFDTAFWKAIINFEKLVEWGTISPEDLHLFKFVDTVDEAIAYLKEDFAQHFLKHL